MRCFLYISDKKGTFHFHFSDKIHIKRNFLKKGTKWQSLVNSPSSLVVSRVSPCTREPEQQVPPCQGVQLARFWRIRWQERQMGCHQCHQVPKLQSKQLGDSRPEEKVGVGWVVDCVHNVNRLTCQQQGHDCHWKPEFVLFDLATFSKHNEYQNFVALVINQIFCQFFVTFGFPRSVGCLTRREA